MSWVCIDGLHRCRMKGGTLVLPETELGRGRKLGRVFGCRSHDSAKGRPTLRRLNIHTGQALVLCVFWLFGVFVFFLRCREFPSWVPTCPTRYSSGVWLGTPFQISSVSPGNVFGVPTRTATRYVRLCSQSAINTKRISSATAGISYRSTPAFRILAFSNSPELHFEQN